jgi:hypothetical protein
MSNFMAKKVKLLHPGHHGDDQQGYVTLFSMFLSCDMLEVDLYFPGLPPNPV